MDQGLRTLDGPRTKHGPRTKNGPSPKHQGPRTTLSVTRLRPLLTLTVGFVIVAALVFAAVAVSSQSLWAFPIVVSLWTAFVWILIGRGITAFSTRPHRPGKIAAIVVACSIAAVVVLAVTIFVGLLLLGPNSADL
jgi:hypothetical protein